MVMKKFWRLLLLLLFGFSMVCSAALAEDGKKQSSAFTWSFYSNHIWQGLELGKINPSLSPQNSKGNRQGLSFIPFRALGSEFSSPLKEDRKAQGVLSYQDSFSLIGETDLNWKLGWLNYDTTHGEETEKTFAGLGLNTFLSPEVNFWKGKEFNQNSWTINFALSQKWNLNNSLSKADGWTLGVGSGLSYSSFDNAGYDDMQNANVWADLNIPFKDGVSLTPSVNYSVPMNDVKRNMYGEGSYRGPESGFVFGGVDLKVPF